MRYLIAAAILVALARGRLPRLSRTRGART